MSVARVDSWAREEEELDDASSWWGQQMTDDTNAAVITSASKEVQIAERRKRAPSRYDLEQR